MAKTKLSSNIFLSCSTRIKQLCWKQLKEKRLIKANKLIFLGFFHLFHLGQVKVLLSSPNIIRKPNLLTQKPNYSLKLLKTTLRIFSKSRMYFQSYSLAKLLKLIILCTTIEWKGKPKLNMTTKRPSRKQIIIPISKINSNTIIS